MGAYRYNPCGGKCCRGRNNSPLVYISGNSVDDVNIRKLGRTGSPPAQLWTFDYGGASGRIHVGSSGRIAVIEQWSASSDPSRPTLRVLDADGNEEWNSGPLGMDLTDCFVTPSDEVFVSRRGVQGEGEGDWNIRKYAASGAVAWDRVFPWPTSLTQFLDAREVTVDADGNSYVAGSGNHPVSQPYQGGVVSFSPTGTVRWDTRNTLNEDAITRSVAVRGEALYLARQTSSSAVETNLVRLNKTSGALIWEADTDSPSIIGLGIDDEGNAYLFDTIDNSHHQRLQKYSAAGVHQWTTTIAEDAPASGSGDIAVDASGRSYVAGVRVDGFTHRSYSTDGILAWAGDHGNHLNGIAIQA